MADDSDVVIQSVVFTPEGGVDITYLEQRNITPAGVMLQMLQVSPGVVDGESLADLARELLDEALRALHPAPERIVRVNK